MFTRSFLFLAFASTVAHADNCEAIRAQIDAKINAAGVRNYSVTVVEAAASTPGKIVGTCNKAANKIVYTQNKPTGLAATAALPNAIKTAPSVKKKSETILTECKDGSTSAGGTCKK